MAKATREIRTTQAERQMQLRTTASNPRHSREIILCDQERCGKVFADTTMSSMCGHNERSFRTTSHNDECRDRVGKLIMDEGAQRVDSYFERHDFEKKPAQEEQQRVQDPRQS